MNIEQLAIDSGAQYVQGKGDYCFMKHELEAFAKALQSSEPVATAVYEIYAGLDNWREVSKAEYDDYKRTKRMLVTANANDFCYAELQAVYDEMYVHKDVARVANQLYKLIHSRTLPPSTISLEEHNKRIAELEAEVTHWKANHKHEVERARLIKSRTDLPLERAKAYDRCSIDKLEALQATNKTLLDALRVSERFIGDVYGYISRGILGSERLGALAVTKQAIADAEGVVG